MNLDLDVVVNLDLDVVVNLDLDVVVSLDLDVVVNLDVDGDVDLVAQRTRGPSTPAPPADTPWNDPLPSRLFPRATR